MRKLKRSRKRRKLKRIKNPVVVPQKIWKEDIVQASYCLYGDYLQFDEELSQDNRPNPEQCTIKNDSYLKLSDDAKEVLGIIISAPAEFVDACISPKDGRYRVFQGDSSYYIRKFFRKKWKSRLKVKRTFKEVEKYLRKIK